MTLKSAKRIVIKVGSSLIAEQESGKVRKKWLKSLSNDISHLLKQGKEVVIVTSGAVALGKKYISGKNKANMRLEEKQAAAACGQIELVEHYQKYLRDNGIISAQILVTPADSENRRNYLNARNTIETLLESQIVPIINENDTVSTKELRFGDNDRLSAIVAQMISADFLIILSDVDGLYDKNPNLHADASHIAEVSAVTESMEEMARGSHSDVGTGGMSTKLEAAKISISNGCNVAIASGIQENPIKRLYDGAKHSVFLAEENPTSARKRWIASSLNIKGEVFIDKGALNALRQGKSLLPAGVIDVVGEFERGDCVAIKDHKKRQLGFGLVAYSSVDACLIKGQQSKEIENIVGFSGRDELIHRDHLVLQDRGEA